MNTEWLILADYVEFANGKLYMMGGGWDQLTINHPARVHNCGIAAAFRLQWEERNDPLDATLSIYRVGSAEPIAEIQAHLEFGQQPEFQQGRSQIAQLALNIAVQFESEGEHALRADIQGETERVFPFLIRFGQLPQELP